MVGLGYADTVMRACTASDCHDMKGVDVDAARTRRDRFRMLPDRRSSTLP